MATESRESQHPVEVVKSESSGEVRESTQTEEVVLAIPTTEILITQGPMEVDRGDPLAETRVTQYPIEVVGNDLFSGANVHFSQMVLEVIFAPMAPAPVDTVLNVFVTT